MKLLTIVAVIIRMMALAACGEAPSPVASNTPDLEATVTARAEATHVGQPNVPTASSKYYDNGVE